MIFPEFQNKTVVSEELTIYRKRIVKLNETIVKLFQCRFGDEKAIEKLEQLQNMLLLLKAHVENADTLNTGGYFEWVDSQIVKSLKCGQYISLEHVNLCSSAVLDRLNPVFEPNGSLMISEKGVSSDSDTTEVVEKSQNFRAFLTIDPKNGELSRAMRNRCVELSLVGMGSLDLDDKRLLVYNEGIHDIDAINTLINIHENISSLTEINNFTISHLTQMAFLAASYRRIGYQLQRAIYVSGMEVYVYSANIDLMGYGLTYYQNKLREIVAAESQKYGHLKAEQDDVKEDYIKDVVINCNELTETSMIKLQLVPLRIALSNSDQSTDCVKESLVQVFSAFNKVNFENVEMKTLLKYIVYILYESSSLKDLRLRHLLVKQLMEKQPELQQHADNLNEVIIKCAHDLDLNTVSPNLPWNPKLFPRIRDYTFESLKILENGSFCLSSSLIAHTLLNAIPHEKVGKLSNIDGLTYSQAVALKTITDKLDNDFLRYYSTFMENLERILKTYLQQGQVDVDLFIALHTSLQWFNRLLEVSKMNLFINKETNTDLLDKLILHFKWLDKKLIQQLKQIFPGNVLEQLEDSLQKLYSYVDSVKHPLNVLRKYYVKHLTNFQPFYKEEQVSVFPICPNITHSRVNIGQVTVICLWY